MTSLVTTGPNTKQLTPDASEALLDTPPVAHTGAGNAGPVRSRNAKNKPLPAIPVWEKELLTIPEAAAMLSLGKSTVYAMAESKKIPSIHVGRKGTSIRVPRKALEEWIEANTKPGIVLEPNAVSPQPVPEWARGLRPQKPRKQK